MDVNGSQIAVKFRWSGAADAFAGGPVGIFLKDADLALAYFSMEIWHGMAPEYLFGEDPMLKAIRPGL